MTLAKSKAKTNETFIIQASLMIVTYDRKNMFIVQATGVVIYNRNIFMIQATPVSPISNFPPKFECRDQIDFLSFIQSISIVLKIFLCIMTLALFIDGKILSFVYYLVKWHVSALCLPPRGQCYKNTTLNYSGNFNPTFCRV
jgi:hypothetical protein